MNSLEKWKDWLHIFGQVDSDIPPRPGGSTLDQWGTCAHSPSTSLVPSSGRERSIGTSCHS
ncbi:unnamed protein product [Spirodela intermedia]|uniref:Uncharacterized protein n=1 Tax=Spirodela intermedia TaxID=51605 RepID=A0ABN7EBW7_SPIIN|nr:unnamed protein product [Spirodela intermedia]